MWGVELRDGLCGVQKAREEGECLLGWQPLDLVSAVSSCLHFSGNIFLSRSQEKQEIKKKYDDSSVKIKA